MSTTLIVKPSSLGDIVHTLPAARFLKRSFPGTNFLWVVNTEWAPLLGGNPDISKVIPLPRNDFRGPSGIRRFLKWCRQFPSYQIDRVLDFQGLLRSAWIARSCRANEVVGLSDAREGALFFYQATASVDSNRHSVERYLELAKLAGADVSGEVCFPLPEGAPIEGLQIPMQFVLLHPFSRGAKKSLTDQEISEIIQGLSPLPVLIVGRTDRTFSLAVREAGPAKVFDLINQTDLHQLIWLLRRADFVISVDSGPMHLAAAVSKRLLSIHFWSDPGKVGPYRQDAWIWKSGHFFRMSDRKPLKLESLPAIRPNPAAIADLVREELLP